MTDLRDKNSGIMTLSQKLRDPITSVCSLSQILNDYTDIDDVKRKEFLGIILQESQRLGKMINQLTEGAGVHNLLQKAS